MYVTSFFKRKSAESLTQVSDSPFQATPAPIFICYFLILTGAA